MRIFGALAFSATMTLVGIVCLVWPYRIQEYYLKSPHVAKFNPFFDWMKTPSYISSHYAVAEFSPFLWPGLSSGE